MLREQLGDQPKRALERQRREAFTAAANIMFPGSTEVDTKFAAAELGPPELSQSRLASLETIRRWANVEIGLIEKEWDIDQPWSIFWVSKKDPDHEGILWETTRTEAEARQWAAPREDQLIFGRLVIRHT